RECSSVPVPSNTWVLLVLNWKLGAGTSLAYLTASCCLAADGWLFGHKIRIGNECAHRLAKWAARVVCRVGDIAPYFVPNEVAMAIMVDQHGVTT
ncbi:hypothetical protein Dimus_028755, partial [Dionaea muscipula]